MLACPLQRSYLASGPLTAPAQPPLIPSNTTLQQAPRTLSKPWQVCFLWFGFALLMWLTLFIMSFQRMVGGLCV